MLTTLFKKTFQNGGGGGKVNLCFCVCPPSWKNDFNNVVGIDNIIETNDINRVNRVKLHADGEVASLTPHGGLNMNVQA